jgi:O-antigen/teichoic acid export membrane protein
VAPERRGVTRLLPRAMPWARSEFAQPLHRNAYALVASGGLTSLLGLAYWALAARRYSAHDLGLQSAAISAMLLLAGVAQLGLIPVLMRFLPVAGPRARSLVVRSYSCSTFVALVAAAVFILGTPLWSPPLAFLRSSGAWWAAFLLATAATSISSLQDGALTGMRRAVWVPIENSLVSVAKMLLLVVFAASLPRSGIFASWNIATAFAVVGINGLLFSKVFRGPSSFPADGGDGELLLRRLIRPALHNHVGNMFSLGVVYALPLIVVFRLGAEPTAYFAIPWAIYSAGLQQITTAMSWSLTVEAAATPSNLRPYMRRTLLHAFALLVPAAALVASFAPQLLGLLGPRYAAEGADLLRWLALASLPGAALPMTLALARIRNSTSIVMTTQAATAAVVISLSTVLLPSVGLAAIGISALVTNCAFAVVAGWKYLWPAFDSMELRGRERCQAGVWPRG